MINDYQLLIKLKRDRFIKNATQQKPLELSLHFHPPNRLSDLRLHIENKMRSPYPTQ